MSVRIFNFSVVASALDMFLATFLVFALVSVTFVSFSASARGRMHQSPLLRRNFSCATLADQRFSIEPERADCAIKRIRRAERMSN